VPKVDYHTEFKKLLDSGVPVSADQLFAASSLGTAKYDAKLKQLRKFLSSNPQYVCTVRGVLPSVEAIVNMACQELALQLSEKNVVSVNQRCKEIVQRVTSPVLEDFVRDGLKGFIEKDKLTAPVQKIVDFFADDFSGFARSSGNGLASIAGSINELLLVGCLQQVGLTSGDFTKTGKKSVGDITLHSKGAGKPNLNIEIKSYHARERLLRGLSDAQHPKVGAGFFVDPLEFGPGRTRTLLQTNAAAIYMPSKSLANVASSARSMTTNEEIAFGSKFYRPLERFASDMKYFVRAGQLPKI
jgi:hypothetical protein